VVAALKQMAAQRQLAAAGLQVQLLMGQVKPVDVADRCPVELFG